LRKKHVWAKREALPLNSHVLISLCSTNWAISPSPVPAAYKEFDEGSAFKYVIDPHGSVAA